jgi:hypothetical protein
VPTEKLLLMQQTSSRQLTGLDLAYLNVQTTSPRREALGKDVRKLRIGSCQHAEGFIPWHVLAFLIVSSFTGALPTPVFIARTEYRGGCGNRPSTDVCGRTLNQHGQSATVVVGVSEHQRLIAERELLRDEAK